MCDQWQKPKQGVFLSITCKCSTFCIAKRLSGKYELLKMAGVIWRGLGKFDSADEAKEAVK